jgi:type II secretory pathway pseudopilin PulG
MQLPNSRIAQPRSAAPAPESAYSIIEVLVAISVLAVMFVSLYIGFSGGFAIIKVARENLRATQILQEKMETIRLYTWEQVNTEGFIPESFIENYYSTSTNNTSGIWYTGAVSVATTKLTESYADDVREVKINIQWTSAGTKRSREMTTFVTRNGLQNYIY